jgi:hypothetical protein
MEQSELVHVAKNWRAAGSASLYSRQPGTKNPSWQKD